MRLLTLATLALASPLCAGQRIIERVRELPSGNEVPRGGIFDPNVGLRVELNAAELRKQLSVPGDDQEVAALYRRLDAYTQSARRGLEALAKVAATNDQASIGALSDAVNTILEELKKDDPQVKERINARIVAETLKGVNPLLASTRLVFEEARARSEALRAQVFREVPQVNVHLDLSRTTDLSREPDATFGILPGQQSQTALNSFISNFDPQTHDLRNVTPESVWRGLAAQFKTAALATYGDLKEKTDKLAQQYEEKADTTIKAFAQGSPQVKEWEGIAADAKATAVLWSQVRVDAQTLIGASAESQDAFNAFVSKANALSTSLLELQTKLAALGKRIDDAPKPTASDAKDAAAVLKTLTDDATATANALVKQVVASAGELARTAGEILGLVDVLESVAETSAEAKNGIADFTQVNGAIKGLVVVHSYDRVRVTVRRVQVIAPGTTANPATTGNVNDTANIGESYDIWAWKKDRFDNVLAVGFYPREDSNRWSVAPIVGQVYKLTMRTKSFTVNRNLPGIGYSVMALDQDDDGQQEVGLGAMLSLFDDHFVGGYGYNLAGKGGYWYVGYRFPLRR